MIALEKKVSLKTWNSFGVDVFTDFFAVFRSPEELDEILNLFDIARNPFLVIGEGNNLLFTGDFAGLVLHPGVEGIRILEEEGDTVIVSAGAGENWDHFVKYCVEKNWCGLENLSLIPGSVGSAPIQNIGAYGVELRDRMEYLEAYDLEEKRRVVLQNADCGFGYRTSIFKEPSAGRYIITRVVFRLTRKPDFRLDYGEVRALFEKRSRHTAEDLRQTIIDIRRSKLPETDQYGNAGSFFKNPVVANPVFKCIEANYREVPHYPAGENMVKIPAAWLIEQAGWKGKRIGNVGTWPFQPLVIVNYGGAAGKEIYEFSERIREDVETKFGIALEREVQVL
ncbi:MAG: UDP-N-acetylmuramate dehydrogenase [Bacteroidales bacterium]|nr:UDP-N-acetylmuramate dehydrogenase [Bacteroidales bacterium]MBN2697584.1 UDP-N-acetylmuramate dehydrogenase [Bacteroidales bacterium]